MGNTSILNGWPSNPLRVSQSPASVSSPLSPTLNGAADLTESMKNNGWAGDPIDVVRMSDGKLTTIDNTRVSAASRAGVNVKARIHEALDALPSDFVERFTTKKGTPSSWEEAINLRIGKQSAGYRNQYPSGSPVIGTMD